ncbi:MAG: GNAT family N-acetyltransferase [Bacteroidota bacterium]
MVVLTTERLTLRHLTEADAPFLLRLLNEPSFLRFIGDRGVRTEADAQDYLRTGLWARYADLGHGLYAVERQTDGVPLGICGLLKRDTLDAPDLGFALVQEYWGQGYAHEAARAILDNEVPTLGLGRVLAITVPDNVASIALLERLGFRFEATLEEDSGALQRYVWSP